MSDEFLQSVGIAPTDESVAAPDRSSGIRISVPGDGDRRSTRPNLSLEATYIIDVDRVVYLS